MAISGHGIVTESYSHRFREGGYRVDIARATGREKGGKVITLQGGLTDNLSRSMGTAEKDIAKQRGLAHALIEASGGELIVASVATTRPKGFTRKAIGSSRSRSHRSKANAGAAKYMSERFEPETIIMGGQSLGGISALDGALHRTRMHKAGKSTVTVDGVITIDSPGIFGPLKYDGPLVEGLIILSKNCWSDMKHQGNIEKAKFLGPHILNLANPFEYAFVMNEIGFSHDKSFEDEIAELRDDGVSVNHIFHTDDCIPGADVPSPHSIAFPGGHARFMYEPEPVAQYIVEFADSLPDRPHFDQAA